MTRILLAVNDSPAGLAAARTAIRLARDLSGPVLAVTVVPDQPRAEPDGTESSERASRALLDYIAQLAREAQVPTETRLAHGRPAPVILEMATAWGPDVIVLGRSGVRHVGQPFVGSQVLHMIEFTDVPVLVVPAM